MNAFQRQLYINTLFKQSQLKNIFKGQLLCLKNHRGPAGAGLNNTAVQYSQNSIFSYIKFLFTCNRLKYF